MRVAFVLFMGRDRVDKTAPINDEREEKEADKTDMRSELETSALNESASVSNKKKTVMKLKLFRKMHL